MSKARIVHCFLNADMRCSQPGLAKMALKEKVKIQELGLGEYLIFINSKRNKIKILAGDEVLAYYRMRSGEHLNMQVIQKIPQAFMGIGKIDYDGGLREVIKEEMGKRRFSPLDVARATA